VAWTMRASEGIVRLRQAVGSFDDAAALDTTAHILVDQGVARPDLTVLVGKEALDAKLLPHVKTDPTSDLNVALKSMNTVGSTNPDGLLLASAGMFGDFLFAASSNEVESSDPFLSNWLPNRHADYLHQQLDAGAALLWVNVRNGQEERRAGTALLRHSRHQVQMHDFSFPGPTPTAA